MPGPIENLNRINKEMCPYIDSECGEQLKGIICLNLKHKKCKYYKEVI